MVEVVRMVCLDFLVQAHLDGGAAMFLSAATGATGGDAGKEMGDAVVHRVLG